MRVVITCGPAFEPIDEVRRITNFSTGELGLLLANTLEAAGHEILCFKGVGATCPIQPAAAVTVLPFSTNGDLLEKLRAVRDRPGVGAVFHAAALSDFRVKQTSVPAARKISSRAGEWTLTLEPASKLITALRGLFPRSRLVGWKYELEGDRRSALEKAHLQISTNCTDVCVLNGAAYGPGFGWCQPPATPVELAGKPALCHWILRWLQRVR